MTATPKVDNPTVPSVFPDQNIRDVIQSDRCFLLSQNAIFLHQILDDLLLLLV